MSSPLYTLDETLPTAVVIIFRLGLDVDVESFNDITTSLIDAWPIKSGRNVLVDLAQSRYMGSVLLGLLINIRSRTRAGGGKLVVVGASPRLIEVFRSANLDRLIVLASDRANGLALLER
jgi:anti-anti-sigma factor